MAKNRIWDVYPASYRSKEMEVIARWIAAGESGSVVGLSGSGRSNLLGFLCHRPDILQQYLAEQSAPIAVIPVDIYNLPSNDLSSLYRTILHAFYWVREGFDSSLQQIIMQLYMENRGEQDPFLSQRALYDLLMEFQNQQTQVVLILNRFDRFCQTATPQMLNTMRGLRDSFKDTLCYIVGMLQEVIYLPDPTVLGDMYELLDSHVCWVGAMSESDARQMLKRLMQPASESPTEAEIAKLLALSGCFPVLLRAVGQWWLMSSAGAAPSETWLSSLIDENNILYRLERMWSGLTQEEQLALSEIQKLQREIEKGKARKGQTSGSVAEESKRGYRNLSQRQAHTLGRLEGKGVCHQFDGCWWVCGELLAAYVQKVEGAVKGGIWIDKDNKTIYQGHVPIEGLSPLQYNILSFLIDYPHTKQTRDNIIDYAWPDSEQREGITPNALQAHIATIRKKVELNPAQPRYLITWHGRPGGYQFYPEGKPA